MAMTPCRSCGNDVAATAKTCPQCGIKHPALDAAASKNYAAATAAWSLGCLLMLGLAMVMFVLLLVAFAF
jgi:uncharacterized membrane protein YvbJ